MAGASRRKSAFPLGIVVWLVAAAILIAAVVVTVPLFVDWEAARNLAEKEASIALGRKVTISGLKGGIFTGIHVEGLVIAGRKGGAGRPMLTAEKAIAKYRVMPLFLLRVAVHRLELINPEVDLFRDRRGRWSFRDVAERLTRGPAGGARPPSAAGTSGGKGGEMVAVSVAIESFRITGGTLRFRDDSGKSVREVGLGALDFEAGDFDAEGSPVKVRGRADVKVGEVVVPVRLSGRVDLDIGRSVLTLDGMRLEAPGARIVATGEVAGLGGRPTWKVESRVEGSLEEFWRCFSPFAGPGAAREAELSGRMYLDASLRGSAEKPRFRGTVTFSDVGFRIGSVAVADMAGAVVFDDDRISTSNLRFITCENPFTFMCDVRNLKLSPPGDFRIRKFSPQGKLVLESPRLVLDRFMAGGQGAAAGTEGGVPEVSKSPPKEPDFRRAMPRGLRLTFEFRFNEVRYRRLLLSRVVSEVRLGRGNASVSLLCESYSGRQTASAALTLVRHPLEFALRARGDGIRVRRLLDDWHRSFSPGESRGQVGGTARFSVKLSGKGVTAASLRRNLKGAGEIMVAEGGIRRSAFFRNGLGRILRLRFLSRSFDFASAGGRFTVSDGRLRTRDFVLDPGEDGDLWLGYSGYVTFDRRMRGEMTTRFSPRHSRRLLRDEFGSSVFRKENGWAAAGWEVRGTFSDPVLQPSGPPVRRKSEEAEPDLREKARRFLGEVLGR